MHDLNNVMAQISDDLLMRTREEKTAERSGEGKGPKSLIETLSRCLFLRGFAARNLITFRP